MKMTATYVSVLMGNKVCSSGSCPRESHRELVSLGARIHEVHDRQRVRERPGEPFGVRGQLRVVVPRVSAQLPALLPLGLDDMRMRVSAVRDVVHAVDVHSSVRGDQMRAAARYDVQRARLGCRIRY